MSNRRNRKVLLPLFAVLLALAIWWIGWGRSPQINPARLRSTPLILQGDYREVVAVFGGQEKSVSTSGCGATCIAMAANYLTGRNLTPTALFEWANENGYYSGDGLSHECLREMASRNGMRGEWVKNEAEPVISALKEGLPVIAHMGPGTFTEGGHYILLTGVDESGMITVNDPASAERSARAYEMALILRELRRENSFMILRRAYG